MPCGFIPTGASFPCHCPEGFIWVKLARSKHCGCWGTAWTPLGGPMGLRGGSWYIPAGCTPGAGAGDTARGQVWGFSCVKIGYFQRFFSRWGGGVDGTAVAWWVTCTPGVLHHAPAQTYNPHSSGGCFGSHIPVRHPQATPVPVCPEKGGKKNTVFWVRDSGKLLGGAEASGSTTTPSRSCPDRARFPGRGELSALPWPRGAAGALSHPTAPRSCPGLCRGVRMRRAHIWVSERGRQSRLGGGTRRGKGDVCFPRGGMPVTPRDSPQQKQLGCNR